MSATEGDGVMTNARLPDALRLSGLQILAPLVGRIRRSRRIRLWWPMPEAPRLSGLQISAPFVGPDKAFTPHPAETTRTDQTP
ncbi:hypothetical protein DMI70_07065 [Escherichia coli]|nr:hypothetical protein [Escherichia coli]